AELLGQEVELLIPERFHEGHRMQRRSYVETPAPRPIGLGLSLWGRRKNGVEFPLDVALIPLTVQDRPMVACTIVDLSERLDARKALAESDQRLRQILDNTSAVIYVKDTNGRYLLINRQFEELFHVRQDHVVGKTDFDIFPREMAEAFRANDRRVLETGEMLKVTEVAPHDDGPHSYSSVKFPLQDSNANVYAVAGISMDITDRVRAEQEVQHVQQRLELIVNSIDDGIFGLDLEGKTTFLNPAAQKMLGWTAADVIGQSHLVKMPQTQRDGTAVEDAANPIQATLSSGTVHHADDKMFGRRDGSRFPVEYHSTPLEEEGQLMGAVVTFHDTTERQRRLQAEQELQAARRVQQHLYPKSPPELPGFDLAGSVFPATEACGDYFDFISLPNDRLALVVGDVAGHGLGPALQMVQTRAYLRAMLMGGRPPAEAIRELNTLLIEDTPHEAFVTLFLAVLDARQRGFVYVGAGHEARLLRANGMVEELTSTGLVLGVLPGAPLQRVGPQGMASGDILLILTDGVLEAYSPERELFGWQRTLDVVRENRHRPATEIVDSLHAATRAFSAGRPQTDDVTILLAKAT
ncbi:MAG: PAS domain S-box protein, partial [Planctomycetes bacterium]|nr:PAS domain S-box protein [Planctomycetota bacterium]